jgi:hypothetical protein
LEGVSSKLWLYRSLLNQIADDNAGLIGPIIVTAAGKALPDGKPDDVDTEFVTVFEVRCQHLKRTLSAGFLIATRAPIFFASQPLC